MTTPRLADPAPPPAVDRRAVPLPELREALRDHRRRWAEFLLRLEAGTLQAEVAGKDDYPETKDAEGLLLLQAVHHGNDHRTQICSTLSALGLEVPDLDGWTYWAEGRS